MTKGNDDINHNINEYIYMRIFDKFQWKIFLYKINTSNDINFIKLKESFIIFIIYK